MTDQFISRVDMERLTGKARFKAQVRALVKLGIKYTLAATGEPLVLVVRLDPKAAPARDSQSKIRWDLLNA